MVFRKVFQDLIALTSAGSDFHDPGIGYLKESASGELVFTRESRFADKVDRMLRIRVETKDGVTSSFAGPRDLTGRGLTDVEIELTRARDALFDEELYHEVIFAADCDDKVAYKGSKSDFEFRSYNWRDRDHRTARRWISSRD